ncbi:MAG TPA: DUF3108 domain-containing protein [Kofleriaceae bacterium]|nr:DUF3108 domain-containing protein [Kofleriaceae bacterium]
MQSAVRTVVLGSLLLACGSRPGSGPAAPAPAPGTAAPAAKQLGEGPPLATPGEHMQYRLSLRGIDLATYDLAVGDVTELDGKKVIVVQGHAKTRGLAAFFATIDDHFTSWVDVATGRSLRFQTDEYATGSKTDIEHAVIDLAGRTGDTIPILYHVNDAPPQPEPQKASLPVTWDYNAFLLALRAWEAPPGTQHTLEVFRSRFMWHSEVTIHGKARLATELGELPALQIDGRTYKLQRNGSRTSDDAERRFTIWISDDDGRVPLQINAVTDYGDLVMQIVDYQPGTGARLRP